MRTDKDCPTVLPRLRTRDEGFTLIELLVVVIIIGVLAAVAIPVFLNQREKAQEAAAKSDARNLSKQLFSYAAGQDGFFSDDFTDLADEGYRRSDGVQVGLCLLTVGGGNEFILATTHESADPVFVIESQHGALVESATATSTVASAILLADDDDGDACAGQVRTDP